MLGRIQYARGSGKQGETIHNSGSPDEPRVALEDLKDFLDPDQTEAEERCADVALEVRVPNCVVTWITLGNEQILHHLLPNDPRIALAD